MTKKAKNKPPATPAHKLTEAQLMQRRLQTEQMLAQGWRHSKIIATLCHNYKIGTKSAEKLITRAYQRLQEHWKPQVDELRVAQVNRLHAILEDATIKVSDRVRVEALLAKIQGTVAPMQHTGKDGGPVEIKMVVEDYRTSTAAPIPQETT